MNFYNRNIAYLCNQAQESRTLITSTPAATLIPAPGISLVPKGTLSYSNKMSYFMGMNPSVRRF